MSYKKKTKQRLFVMHWNAQGITTPSSILQLEHLLHTKHIDVVLINKTFLNSTHKIKIQNFKIYRNDRPSHGGGVLIGIRNTIPHQRISNFQTTSIENVSIILRINNKPVRFTSAYCPRYTSNFVSDIKKMTTDTQEYFIFGDLNAQHTSWNCLNNNTAGRKLNNLQLSQNFYVHYPTLFTRFGQSSVHTQPSVVDLLLTNSSLQIAPIETLPGYLNSDHVPMICQVHGSSVENVENIPLYNRANWKSIRKWVDRQIKQNNIDSAIITSLNIEHLIAKITSIVQEASQQVPQGIRDVWQKKLSRVSLYLLGQRNRYTRKFQRTHGLSERNTIRCILNQLTMLTDQQVY